MQSDSICVCVVCVQGPFVYVLFSIIIHIVCHAVWFHLCVCVLCVCRVHLCMSCSPLWSILVVLLVATTTLMSS